MKGLEGKPPKGFKESVTHRSIRKVPPQKFWGRVGREDLEFCGVIFLSKQDLEDSVSTLKGVKFQEGSLDSYDSIKLHLHVA